MSSGKSPKGPPPKYSPESTRWHPLMRNTCHDSAMHAPTKSTPWRGTHILWQEPCQRIFIFIWQGTWLNLTRTLLDLCRQCQATTLSGEPDGWDGEQLQLFLASSKGGGIGYLPIAFGVGERPSLSTRRTSLFIAAWERDILFWNAQPCHRSSKNLAFSAYPEPQTYL